MMMLFRNTPNASPQGLSRLGSQPAVSVYQAMHWERDGKPRGAEEGMNAGLMRSGMRAVALGGAKAKAKGARRLERSERGCPIVDISQLGIRESVWKNVVWKDSNTLRFQ